MSDIALAADLKSNIEFCLNLMTQFKQKNISEGITASQAMWLHHRMRAWTYTYGGIEYTVDIVNMGMSGDIQTACLALLYGSADSMEEDHHWMSAERKAWLTNEMKSFLGWP